MFAHLTEDADTSELSTRFSKICNNLIFNAANEATTIAHGLTPSATPAASNSRISAPYTGSGEDDDLLARIARSLQEFLRKELDNKDLVVEIGKILTFLSDEHTFAHIDFPKKDEYLRFLMELGSDFSYLRFSKSKGGQGAPMPANMKQLLCFLHYVEDLVATDWHSRPDFKGEWRWNLLINIKGLAKLDDVDRVEIMAKIFAGLSFAIALVAEDMD